MAASSSAPPGNFGRPDLSSSRAAGPGGVVSLEEACRLLLAQHVVAFPTETVYGLAADARSSTAVGRIYATKGRPSDNPLIVHVAGKSQLRQFVDVDALPPVAHTLMSHFWPGPLTLILPIRPGTLSHLTTAGLSTVGVRQVAHPITQKLLEMVDIPVAAPSANVSGRPSPTCAQHVLDDYDGAVPVLEGGVSGVGVESTIVDCTLPASAATDDGGLPWVALLRPGGVPVSALLPFCRVRLPEADLAPSGPCGHDAQATSISSSGQQVVSLPAAEAPRAPGMKYAHYAPQAPVQLVDGSTGFMVRMIHEAWAGPGSRADGARRVGVLTTDEAARQITRQLGFPEDACVRPAPASSSGDGPRSPGPPPPARTFADILPNDVLPRARSVPHPEDPARELVLISLGPAHDVETAARTLYHTLREFDRLGADAILISAPRRFDADTGAAEADRDVGLGLALVNRLVKASAHRVVAEGGPQ